MQLRPANKARPGSNTSLMTWLWRAEPLEFESQQRTHGMGGGDLLGAGELALLQDLVPGHGTEGGHEQKQAAKLGAELAGDKSSRRASAAGAVSGWG